MAFIKVKNVVINTDYIAAVELEKQTCSGERCVSILIANSKSPMLQIELSLSNHYNYERFDFTGKEAKVIEDYFSSFNNVIDLLAQHY